VADCTPKLRRNTGREIGVGLDPGDHIVGDAIDVEWTVVFDQIADYPGIARAMSVSRGGRVLVGRQDMIEDELRFLIEDFLRVGRRGKVLIEDEADGTVYVVRRSDLAAPALYELLVEVLQESLGGTLDRHALLIGQRHCEYSC